MPLKMREINELGMRLVEIPKDITLAELEKQGRIYLWMNRRKIEEGLMINNRKLIKVGENEANYLYQEM